MNQGGFHLLLEELVVLTYQQIYHGGFSVNVVFSRYSNIYIKVPHLHALLLAIIWSLVDIYRSPMVKWLVLKYILFLNCQHDLHWCRYNLP